MTISWDDFEKAFRDARRTIDIADRHVATMAQVIAGRLRKSNVSHSELCALKKELEKYNMHTMTWKD